MGRNPNNKTHKLRPLSRYLNKKSHYKFAKAIGISKTHLSLILSGLRKPSIKVVAKMNVVTDGKLNLKNMRPDIYREVMKHAEVEK